MTLGKKWRKQDLLEMFCIFCSEQFALKLICTDIRAKIRSRGRFWCEISAAGYNAYIGVWEIPRDQSEHNIRQSCKILALLYILIQAISMPTNTTSSKKKVLHFFFPPSANLTSVFFLYASCKHKIYDVW